MDSKLKEIVRAYLPLPENVERLRALCLLDLYFGPIDESQLDDEWERQNYKGFGEALQTIQEWVNEAVRELWVDVDFDCVMTSEPEGYFEEDGEWIEPYLNSTYYLKERDVIEALFGKELGSYL